MLTEQRTPEILIVNRTAGYGSGVGLDAEEEENLLFLLELNSIPRSSGL